MLGITLRKLPRAAKWPITLVILSLPLALLAAHRHPLGHGLAYSVAFGLFLFAEAAEALLLPMITALFWGAGASVLGLSRAAAIAHVGVLIATSVAVLFELWRPEAVSSATES